MEYGSKIVLVGPKADIQHSVQVKEDPLLAKRRARAPARGRSNQLPESAAEMSGSNPFSFGTPSNKPSTSFFTPPPATSFQNSKSSLPFSSAAPSSASNNALSQPTNTSTLSKSLPASMDVDDGEGGEDDDDEMDVCYLRPAAFSRGGKGKWRQGGRSMAVAVSPVGGEVAAWVTKTVCYCSFANWANTVSLAVSLKEVFHSSLALAGSQHTF